MRIPGDPNGMRAENENIILNIRSSSVGHSHKINGFSISVGWIYCIIISSPSLKSCQMMSNPGPARRATACVLIGYFLSVFGKVQKCVNVNAIITWRSTDIPPGNTLLKRPFITGIFERIKYAIATILFEICFLEGQQLNG